jgi:hypothetical protein
MDARSESGKLVELGVDLSRPRALRQTIAKMKLDGEDRR